jgi:hypothetical protein
VTPDRPDAGDEFLTMAQDGVSEEDAAAIQVPSARASLSASRGPLPTHLDSLSHPTLPAPTVNPSGGDTGPAGQGPAYPGEPYPGVNPDPVAGPTVDPSVAPDVGV